jgi:hypothetical protein
MSATNKTPMKKGVCIKCESSTVYRRQDGIGFELNLRIGSRYHQCAFETYLCTSCGYFENYLTNKNELKDVVNDDKWKKLVPPPDDSHFPEQKYGPVILK